MTILEGHYQENGKHQYAFYPGQVWMRHAASNAPATPDDLRAMRSARSELDLIFGLSNAWSQKIDLKGQQVAGELHYPDLTLHVGAKASGRAPVINAVLSLGLFDSANPRFPPGQFAYAEKRTVRYTF